MAALDCMQGYNLTVLVLLQTFRSVHFPNPSGEAGDPGPQVTAVEVPGRPDESQQGLAIKQTVC